MPIRRGARKRGSSIQRGRGRARKSARISVTLVAKDNETSPKETAETTASTSPTLRCTRNRTKEILESNNAKQLAKRSADDFEDITSGNEFETIDSDPEVPLVLDVKSNSKAIGSVGNSSVLEDISDSSIKDDDPELEDISSAGSENGDFDNKKFCELLQDKVDELQPVSEDEENKVDELQPVSEDEENKGQTHFESANDTKADVDHDCTNTDTAEVKCVTHILAEKDECRKDDESNDAKSDAIEIENNAQTLQKVDHCVEDIKNPAVHEHVEASDPEDDEALDTVENIETIDAGGIVDVSEADENVEGSDAEENIDGSNADEDAVAIDAQEDVDGLDAPDVEALDVEDKDIEASDVQEEDVDALDAHEGDVDALDAQVHDVEALDAQEEDFDALDAREEDVDALDAQEEDVDALDAQEEDVDALDAQEEDVDALDAQEEDVDALDAQEEDVDALDAQEEDVNALDAKDHKEAVPNAEHQSPMGDKSAPETCIQKPTLTADVEENIGSSDDEENDVMDVEDNAVAADIEQGKNAELEVAIHGSDEIALSVEEECEDVELKDENVENDESGDHFVLSDDDDDEGESEVKTDTLDVSVVATDKTIVAKTCHVAEKENTSENKLSKASVNDKIEDILEGGKVKSETLESVKGKHSGVKEGGFKIKPEIRSGVKTSPCKDIKDNVLNDGNVLSDPTNEVPVTKDESRIAENVKSMADDSNGNVIEEQKPIVITGTKENANSDKGKLSTINKGKVGKSTGNATRKNPLPSSRKATDSKEIVIQDKMENISSELGAKDAQLQTKERKPIKIETVSKQGGNAVKKPGNKTVPKKNLLIKETSTLKEPEKKLSTYKIPKIKKEDLELALKKNIVLKDCVVKLEPLVDPSGSHRTKEELKEIEQIDLSDGWKIMDEAEGDVWAETNDHDDEKEIKRPFYKKPFIRGIQWGKPAVSSLLKELPGPLVGLDFMVEIWKEDGRSPPRYYCSFCKNLVGIEKLEGHLSGIPHKLEFMRITCVDSWLRFPAASPDSWPEEHTRALDALCQLVNEQNPVAHHQILITSLHWYAVRLRDVVERVNRSHHPSLKPKSYLSILEKLPEVKDTLGNKNKRQGSREKPSLSPRTSKKTDSTSEVPKKSCPHQSDGLNKKSPKNASSVVKEESAKKNDPKSKLHDTKSKPSDAKAKQADTKSKPSDPKSKPVDAKSKPSDLKSKSGNAVATIKKLPKDTGKNTLGKDTKKSTPKTADDEIQIIHEKKSPPSKKKSEDLKTSKSATDTSASTRTSTSDLGKKSTPILKDKKSVSSAGVESSSHSNHPGSSVGSKARRASSPKRSSPVRKRSPYRRSSSPKHIHVARRMSRSPRRSTSPRRRSPLNRRFDRSPPRNTTLNRSSPRHSPSRRSPIKRASPFRRNSPLRRSSPTRRNSPPRRSSPTRRYSPRRSPPRRTLSPRRNSPRRSPLRRISPRRSPVRRLSPRRSPLRRAFSPRRSPSRRNSPSRRSPLRRFSPRRRSPLRRSPHRKSPGRSPSYSPTRKSRYHSRSPLRRRSISPLYRDRSPVYRKRETDRDLYKSRSPLPFTREGNVVVVDDDVMDDLKKNVALSQSNMQNLNYDARYNALNPNLNMTHEKPVFNFPTTQSRDLYQHGGNFHTTSKRKLDETQLSHLKRGRFDSEMHGSGLSKSGKGEKKSANFWESWHKNHEEEQVEENANSLQEEIWTKQQNVAWPGTVQDHRGVDQNRQYLGRDSISVTVFNKTENPSDILLSKSQSFRDSAPPKPTAEEIWKQQVELATSSRNLSNRQSDLAELPSGASGLDWIQSPLVKEKTSFQQSLISDLLSKRDSFGNNISSSQNIGNLSFRGLNSGSGLATGLNESSALNIGNWSNMAAARSAFEGNLGEIPVSSLINSTDSWQSAEISGINSRLSNSLSQGASITGPSSLRFGVSKTGTSSSIHPLAAAALSGGGLEITGGNSTHDESARSQVQLDKGSRWVPLQSKTGGSNDKSSSARSSSSTNTRGSMRRDGNSGSKNMGQDTWRMGTSSSQVTLQNQLPVQQSGVWSSQSERNILTNVTPAPQEDLNLVAQKLNSTLTRILNNYKPTGGLFSNPSLKPGMEGLQQRQDQGMFRPGPVGDKMSLAQNIASALTSMGMANVPQRELIAILQHLGLLGGGGQGMMPSGNRVMDDLRETVTRFERTFQYHRF